MLLSYTFSSADTVLSHWEFCMGTERTVSVEMFIVSSFVPRPLSQLVLLADQYKKKEAAKKLRESLATS